MRHLDRLRVRPQMIIDPARDNRRFHAESARLGQSCYPCIQFAPGRTNLAFPVHMTSSILHTKADRFLVNIQSDVVHIVAEEPPRLFSESAAAEFSFL